MGKECGSVEENFHVGKPRRWWGFRSWKRHSTILMVAGFLYALIGFLYTIAPESKAREIALAVILQIAPIPFWGAVFMLTGALSMISSVWPPFVETWGYMVLTGMSAGWASTYLMGVLFFKAPVTNSTQVALWGILAFMWWAISGLLNPDKTAVTNHAKL